MIAASLVVLRSALMRGLQISLSGGVSYGIHGFFCKEWQQKKCVSQRDGN
jgi:hypothetical protein